MKSSSVFLLVLYSVSENRDYNFLRNIYYRKKFLEVLAPVPIQDILFVVENVLS